VTKQYLPPFLMKEAVRKAQPRQPWRSYIVLSFHWSSDAPARLTQFIEIMGCTTKPRIYLHHAVVNYKHGMCTWAFGLFFFFCHFLIHAPDHTDKTFVFQPRREWSGVRVAWSWINGLENGDRLLSDLHMLNHKIWDTVLDLFWWQPHNT